MVLDHVDPAGQHAVIRDTTRLLEHPLALPGSSLCDGLVERISDGEPAARQVPDTTLDSRPMEGITYLENLALGGGGSLDSGPMEGMSCLEPLEQSILHSLWIAQPKECVIEEGSVWEPVLNPVISFTLDSQLMEGNTYLEHSALGVSLDSGPTEGASCLEPLEQSAPSSSLAVRPVEGVTEKVSEWKPVINPVLSYTLDSRLMEGNTYRECSALGVSLDSGPTEGASCLELLEQSFLSLTLVVRQVEGVTKIVSDWKPVINPVQDITPDGRPMEGTAYPEHLAPGASLDSGLRVGMSSSEPLQQSVCYTSLVA